MVRYSQRPAARQQSQAEAAPQGYYGYQRPQQYYATDLPEGGRQAEYADEEEEPDYPPPRAHKQAAQAPPAYYRDHQPEYEDEDEETMVQTDVSANPPPAAAARAKFGSNPVAHTLAFDNTEEPSRIQRLAPRPSGATLTVPGQGRQRATSLDGRNARPALPTQYGPPPSRQQYKAPPPEREPYHPPAQSRQPKLQPLRQPTVRFPEDDDDQEPPSPYTRSSSLRDYLPRGEDSDEENSDDDKFTAVGTGVATDMDLDDDGYAGGADYHDPYGRDPRDGYSHQRRHSALDGYDPRVPEYDYQGAPSRGASFYADHVNAARQSKKAAYRDEYDGIQEVTRGVQGLAPPRSIQRPSSAGALRTDARNQAPPTRQSIPPPQRAPPKQAPAPLGSVPEDTPEEKNLIHWRPMTAQRWHFATESHKVEIIWKTAAIAAYEDSVKMMKSQRR
ncbi:hypothetical protein MNV49_005081 [Pseudohyphozyma bogoriensis]|nr:hypothetical protein MNV49_005081 [Pseudohyphozyma bogoriensis]